MWTYLHDGVTAKIYSRTGDRSVSIYIGACFQVFINKSMGSKNRFQHFLCDRSQEKLAVPKRASRRDFFYLLDYVTRQSKKKWISEKKKKTEFCLTPLQNCSFLASSEITEKITLSKLYSASVNYVKITTNGVQTNIVM